MGGNHSVPTWFIKPKSLAINNLSRSRVLFTLAGFPIANKMRSLDFASTVFINLSFLSGVRLETRAGIPSRSSTKFNKNKLIDELMNKTHYGQVT